MIQIDKPPVVPITDELIQSSQALSPEDLGRWAVILPDKIVVQDTEYDAVTLQEILTKVETRK